MFKSIAFFVYTVTDIGRARKFYEETLGLKLGMNFQDVWIEYELGDGTLAITNVDMGHKAGALGGAVALEVDDYEKAIGTLKGRHARFVMDTYETPVCHFAVVADPDGNQVMIHKRKD